MSTTIEAPVREHLKKVYTSLSMATFSAGVGAYVHVFTDILQGNFLTSLIGLGLSVALAATPHEPKNQNLRLSLLMGFAFFAGLGLGPLLDFAIAVEPSLVATAFLGTCVVFVCFTLSAMYSRNKEFLYLGGTLGSLASVFMLLSIANIFIRSAMFFQVYLYMGLALFCGFVLYDTQAIIEKRRHGDTDYIWHSVNLFLNFLSIFRHILIILLQSQDTNKRRKKDRD